MLSISNILKEELNKISESEILSKVGGSIILVNKGNRFSLFDYQYNTSVAYIDIEDKGEFNYVSHVVGEKGLGPVMVEIAMMSSYPKYLTSSIEIKPEAQNIWKYYYTNRQDVEKLPLPQEELNYRVKLNPGNSDDTHLNYMFRMKPSQALNDLISKSQEILNKYDYLNVDEILSKGLKYFGSKYKTLEVKPKKLSLTELINRPDIGFHSEPEKISIQQETLDFIKNIPWQNIKMIDSNENDGVSCIRLKVDLGHTQALNELINRGLKIIICLKNTNNPEVKLNQLDMSISPSIQKLGLGTKICRAIIEEFGHVYFAKGFIHNPEAVSVIWSRLRNDPTIDSYENKFGNIMIHKSDPNKEELENIFK